MVHAETEVASREVGENFGVDLSEAQRAKIGLRLGEIRKARNIPQDEAAKRIGISRTHLSNIESGRSRPGWSRLMAMATFYDVTVETMIRQVSEQGESQPQERPPSYRDIVRPWEPPGTHVGVALNPWEVVVIEAIGKLAPTARRRIVDDLMEKIASSLKG